MTEPSEELPVHDKTAGWYPCPWRPGEMRWWDGVQWRFKRRPMDPTEIHLPVDADPGFDGLQSVDQLERRMRRNEAKEERSQGRGVLKKLLRKE